MTRGRLPKKGLGDSITVAMARSPATCFHATPGYRALRSSGRFFAASPMTSKFRTTASCVLRSERNCSYVMPLVYFFILPAASLISSRKWSTVLCIHDLSENVGLEPFLDCALHHEINFAPEEIFEIELAVHITVE
jgi:hypothetical protein